MYLPSDLTLSSRLIIMDNYHKGTIGSCNEGANMDPTPAQGI